MSAVVFLCPQCHTGRPLTPVTVDTRVRCLECETSFRSDGFLFDRAAWKSLDDPFIAIAVAHGAGGEPSARKWRLLAIAVARSAFDWCRNPWFRDALRTAEKWADAGVIPRGVAQCRTELDRVPLPQFDVDSDEEWGTPAHYATFRRQQDREQFGWVQLAQRCISDDPRLQPHDLTRGTRSLAAGLFRELLPDPFALPGWNPDWFTSTVRDLAKHIYNAREFSAMPILADALQDASCDDEQILGHCRGNKPHARGCWVLDAILGKT